MVPVFKLMTFQFNRLFMGGSYPPNDSFSIFNFFSSDKIFNNIQKKLLWLLELTEPVNLEYFFSIVMPSMKATYAAGAIYSFLSSWNAYMQPLVIIQSQKKANYGFVYC